MRPASILRAYHRTPMIKFVGQRSKLTHEPHAPAPHPAAPQEVIDTFQSFLAKLQSSSAGPSNPSSTPKGQSTDSTAKGYVKDASDKSPRPSGGSSSSSSSGSGGSASASKSTGPVDFENFWEAPEYLWMPKEMSEREMDAVMSGGATDIRTGP